MRIPNLAPLVHLAIRDSCVGSHRDMFSFSLKTFALAAVLGTASVSAVDTALCGAHGISLKADNGLSPCEIASLMVGQGGERLPSGF